MERRAKPNLLDISLRVGVQLVFAPLRRYGLSVAVRWYILMRLWLELFVSQAETTVIRKTSSIGVKVTKQVTRNMTGPS